MTDYAKLREKLMSEEGKRYPQNITITKLLEVVDNVTGQLPSKLYVPEYEVSKGYLVEILEKLGYDFELKEEYNPYFEQFCYKVKLSSK